MPSAFFGAIGSAGARGIAQLAVLGFEFTDLGGQRTDVVLQFADPVFKIVDLGQGGFVQPLFGLIEREGKMQFADLFLNGRFFGLFFLGFPTDGQDLSLQIANAFLLG